MAERVELGDDFDSTEGGVERAETMDDTIAQFEKESSRLALRKGTPRSEWKELRGKVTATWDAGLAHKDKPLTTTQRRHLDALVVSIDRAIHAAPDTKSQRQAA